jgi:biotin-[acetyl-CoA-carboxylase] ligase BirA-like protein
MVLMLSCRRRPLLLANSLLVATAGRRATSTSRQFMSGGPTAGMDEEDHILVSSKDLTIFHLRRTVDSTQDETKRLLELHRPTGFLAVIADNQRKGRGTSGRSWVASEGNLFLTCAVPMNIVPLSKVTLLPLGVGLLVAEHLDRHLSCRPNVKWPNDVLVDGKKIAGTLIENHRVGQDDFWLVGIGVNVKSHPKALPTERKDFRAVPRSATSMQEYASPEQKESPPISALDLGLDLTRQLQEWTKDLAALDSAEFTSTWKAWSQLGMEYEIRETGEKVRVVDIAHDGQLRVIDNDGNQRLLVADYFY